MLRYLLDTNICIHLLRHRPAALRARLNGEADSPSISTIALTELLHGCAKSARPRENRAQVESLAGRVEVLPFDAAAADHTGDIRAALESQGFPIGAYDVLIAGHARSRGLAVVTTNLGEFARVPGLRCENWIESEYFYDDTVMITCAKA